MQFFLLKFHENCCFFKPIFCENFEIAAVQKDANLVELEKILMLSNAYFLAKFRFDTAKNEPAKNLQNFANISPLLLTLTPNRMTAPHGTVPPRFA